MFQEFNNVYISSISSCIPKNKVENSYFSALLSEKEVKVFEKTVGIRNRRWAENDVTASDLGYKAAKTVLEAKDISKVKCLIFLSQTSDYKIPFTSNILQAKLGLPTGTLCLDINAGCAGFIQGLSVAFAMANTLAEDENVLLIIGETLSKILSPSDKATNMLFGDAASAILIAKSNRIGKSYFNFYSDGGNYEAIIIPDGGYRNPYICDDFIKTDNDNYGNKNLYLQMQGSKVFDFTLREVAPSVKNLMEHFHLDIQTVDGFFFHQSNRFIIKQISTILGIDHQKVAINIEEFGNTSGVSIPLLLNTELHKFEVKDKILCSGYGSGLNWGNCLLDLSLTYFHTIKEY
jgi:3-oxoacyl-[acyl-carrier-protein] synthase-3